MSSCFTFLCTLLRSTNDFYELSVINELHKWAAMYCALFKKQSRLKHYNLICHKLNDHLYIKVFSFVTPHK